jgi:hypothetical protein
VVATQSVFANLIGTRMEVGDQDPGVISTFAADDLAGRERIDPSESSLLRPPAVDPTRLQVGEISGGQIGSDQTTRAKTAILLRGIDRNKWPTLGRVFACYLRALAV